MKSALRLRRPADFARVYRTGSVYRDRVVHLRVRSNGLSHNRYGIVTSKAIGIAVVRNRCKRRLRAIVVCLHSLARQGFDIVVVARRKPMSEPFGELTRILRRLFVQAGLIGSC